MKRTNIYLEERQHESLRRLAEQRGVSVAALTRAALDDWLAQQGVRPIGRDEWERRFDELLGRRRARAEELGLEEVSVEREVMAAIREVREARAARRR